MEFKFTTWFRDAKMNVCDNLDDLIAYHNDPRGGKHLETVISVNSRPNEFFASVNTLIAALGLRDAFIKGPVVLPPDDDPDL